MNLDKPWPHYVYRLYDAAGGLLYIGCTEDVEGRIYMHLTQGASTFAPTLHTHYDHYTAEEHPNAREAHAAEVAAIRAECPPLNLHHNPKVWRRAKNGAYVPVDDYPQILRDDPCFIRRDRNGLPLIAA